MGEAFVEMRGLAFLKEYEQCFDLADAFHNLPFYLHSEQFDWDICRRFLVSYQTKYPYCGLPEMQVLIEKSRHKTTFQKIKLFFGFKIKKSPKCAWYDYVDMLDKIRAGEAIKP